MADIIDVSPKPPLPPEYLGGGLYVEFDGWQIRLSVQNPFDHTSEVFLEPEVLAAFERYVAKLKGGASNATG